MRIINMNKNNFKSKPKFLNKNLYINPLYDLGSIRDHKGNKKKKLQYKNDREDSRIKPNLKKNCSFREKSKRDVHRMNSFFNELDFLADPFAKQKQQFKITIDDENTEKKVNLFSIKHPSKLK